MMQQQHEHTNRTCSILGSPDTLCSCFGYTTVICSFVSFDFEGMVSVMCWIVVSLDVRAQIIHLKPGKQQTNSLGKHMLSVQYSYVCSALFCQAVSRLIHICRLWDKSVNAEWRWMLYSLIMIIAMSQKKKRLSSKNALNNEDMKKLVFYNIGWHVYKHKQKATLLSRVFEFLSL